jgi:uncharacterized membrane protein
MSTDNQMTGHWPCRLAALAAVIAGVLMMLMGGGHLNAVISAALTQDRALDYRLVSLVTTGVMLAFPGLLSVVLCPWLWKGKVWAYGMCIVSTVILMIYLSLLLFALALDPEKVGSELNIAAMIVGAYLSVLIVVWISMRIRQRHHSADS